MLGDYSLTLVDALDTLAVMGNASEFKRAVRLVVDNVSFDKPSTVQVHFLPTLGHSADLKFCPNFRDRE